MGQKADKHFSGGVMDYEDGDNDLLASDAHAKNNLPEEKVDHGSMSHGKGHRVSISRSKHSSQDKVSWQQTVSCNPRLNLVFL